MQTIYDEETTAEIERIQQRMAGIKIEMASQLITATTINEFEIRRQRNPYYNPLAENMEYQLLQARLTQILQTAVPKYLLSVEEYEAYKRNIGAIAGGKKE